MYLTNLLFGLSLEQTVSIVSEHGEIKGYLKVVVQQLPLPSTEHEINQKSKRNLRNTSGLSKIVFDDDTYFQVKINQMFFSIE